MRWVRVASAPPVLELLASIELESEPSHHVQRTKEISDEEARSYDRFDAVCEGVIGHSLRRRGRSRNTGNGETVRGIGCSGQEAKQAPLVGNSGQRAIANYSRSLRSESGMDGGEQSKRLSSMVTVRPAYRPSEASGWLRKRCVLTASLRMESPNDSSAS